MKNYLLITSCLLFGLISADLQAQAFNKHTKLVTIGIGGASMLHLPTGYTWYAGGSFFSPVTGELTVQGEFAIHKYIGLGFTAGIGGRGNGIGVAGTRYYGVYNYSGYGSEFNIPVGMIANCHFYQIIADKSSKGSKMHADKLDIYAGLNIGTGVAIHPAGDYYSTTRLDALFFIGPQVGVHYYFTDKFGINGEVGYGKTFVTAGVTFKMGGAGKAKK